MPSCSNAFYGDICMHIDVLQMTHTYIYVYIKCIIYHRRHFTHASLSWSSYQCLRWVWCEWRIYIICVRFSVFLRVICLSERRLCIVRLVVVFLCFSLLGYGPCRVLDGFLGWILQESFGSPITREEGVRKDQISLTVLFNSDSLCWLGYVKFPTPHWRRFLQVLGLGFQRERSFFWM